MNFFGSGLADVKDLAYEMEVVAGEGMVEVHHHFLRGNLFDDAVDAIAFGSHHREGGAGSDALGVKLAVDEKDIFGEADDSLGIGHAEAVGSCHSYIKSRAGLKAVDGCFEGLDHTLGDAIDEALGILVSDLMDELLLGGAVADGKDAVEVVGELHVFAGLYLFHKKLVMRVDKSMGLRGNDEASVTGYNKYRAKAVV